MRFFSLSVAAAALIALAPAAATADVKVGVDAWAAGNFGAAIRAWRPLAEKGDADAQFNMGQAYKLGRGVPADTKIAQSWFQKAAAQGHEQAQSSLGLLMFHEGNRAGAMPWIKKAAERGDPRAQYIYGTALFNGDLVGKDWPRAYALMTQAAAKGLPVAADTLSKMDQFIPLAERQKGIALARRTGGTATAAAAKPPRVAGGAAPAAAKAAAPAAKPADKPAVQTAKASSGGKWRVQLGAYGSQAAAQGQWTKLSKIGGLAGLSPSYEPAGKLTRLRVGPLASKAAADKACAAAKAAGQACFPVGP